MNRDYSDFELRYGAKQKILLNVPKAIVSELDEMSTRYDINRSVLIREALLKFILLNNNDLGTS